VSDETIDLLVFTLEPHRFAVRARRVQETVRAVAIAAVPDAPDVVEGAINFRGQLVPVIDVRRRFGLPPRPLDPSQHLIVAEAGPRAVVLRVDHALELISVDADAVESAERVAPGAQYTEGIARLPDGLVIIHDLERFLSLEEGRQVDSALMALPEAGAENSR
jgi:purine-binding chemotaxis protein CheW